MTLPYGPLLVVEDIPNVLDLLAVALRFKGYPVLTATNGQEALTKIAEEHPALVITDILMPKMDGFALVHEIRKNLKTSSIPVIFLSATYVTLEDKRFALNLGAVRFLEKPVDTEEFLLSVAEVLTQGPMSVPPPMEMSNFYQGYSQRLESKLRHKSMQITRTERLLETVPESQRSAFQALLDESNQHKQAIEKELHELSILLQEIPEEN